MRSDLCDKATWQRMKNFRPYRATITSVAKRKEALTLVPQERVLQIPSLPSCQIRKIKVEEPLYQDNFYLILVLDQTGSIGLDGARRGVAIIDFYGEKIKKLGWVSFGDIVCQQKSLTSDITAARAELESYATGAATSPFFCDNGGDTPENGIDGLYYADSLFRSETIPTGVKTYIHLVTDTAGYDHNVQSAASVNSSLNSNFYSKVFMEVGTASGGTNYIDSIEASSTVQYLSYPYTGA